MRHLNFYLIFQFNFSNLQFVMNICSLESEMLLLLDFFPSSNIRFFNKKSQENWSATCTLTKTLSR